MNYTIDTCRSCGTQNRIPADKEGKQGHCGKCRAGLSPMYRHPQQLSTSNSGGYLERSVETHPMP